MIKKKEFINRIVDLIKKRLEEILPNEATLEEMYHYLEKIIKKL